MRKFLYYFMSIVLLTGAMAAYLWRQDADERRQKAIDQAIQSLRRLDREIRVRSATAQVSVNGRGWSETVDPAWFGEDPPLNPLVPVDRPWLEIAASDEEKLTDPPIRQTVTRGIAAYWYNPANGILRSRVGPTISDAQGLHLYNQVNGTNLATLFDSDRSIADEADRSTAFERLLSRPGKSAPLVVVRRLANTPHPAQQPPVAETPAKPAEPAPAPPASITDAGTPASERAEPEPTPQPKEP